MNQITIPDIIHDRLVHFNNETSNHFSFLYKEGYDLHLKEKGRTDNFLDYYSKFEFRKGDTSLRVYYSTDIIRRHRIAFPKLEHPTEDNSISCFISDDKAFMTVDLYAETVIPGFPKEQFEFDSSANIQSEISRIVKSYSSFVEEQLMNVIRREKIYSCYVDRDYEKVFKEFNYR